MRADEDMIVDQSEARIQAEEKLSAFIKEFEAGFDLVREVNGAYFTVDGDSQFQVPTAYEHDKMTEEEKKDLIEPFVMATPSCDTALEAVDHFIRIVSERAKPDDCGTLVWRVRPELAWGWSARNNKHMCRVYARLAVLYYMKKEEEGRNAQDSG